MFLREDIKYHVILTSQSTWLLNKIDFCAVANFAYEVCIFVISVLSI